MTDINDTNMTIAPKRDVAATEAPTGTSPPARRVKRAHEDLPAAGISSASKPTTLDELGAVVQALQAAQTRGLTWRSEVEKAMADHADKLDQRRRDCHLAVQSVTVQEQTLMKLRSDVENLDLSVGQVQRDLKVVATTVSGIGTDTLQSDIQRGLTVLDDNDAFMKGVVESNDKTLKACLASLSDGLDTMLRKHTQEAIVDMGRRLDEIEAGGTAARAMSRTTETALRLEELEGKMVQADATLADIKTANEQALLLEKISVMKVVDLVKGRLTRLESVYATSPPAQGPSVDIGAASAEARTEHGAPVDGFPLGGGAMGPTMLQPPGIGATGATPAEVALIKAQHVLREERAAFEREKVSLLAAQGNIGTYNTAVNTYHNNHMGAAPAQAQPPTPFTSMTGLSGNAARRAGLPYPAHVACDASANPTAAPVEVNHGPAVDPMIRQDPWGASDCRARGCRVDLLRGP